MHRIPPIPPEIANDPQALLAFFRLHTPPDIRDAYEAGLARGLTLEQISEQLRRRMRGSSACNTLAEVLAHYGCTPEDEVTPPTK